MAQVIILQMNGDKVEKSLNYLPQGKPFYNIVYKGRQTSKAQYCRGNSVVA